MGYNDKYPDMSAMYSIMFETEDKLKNKIKELETDLERTRKALDVAVDALKHYCTDSDNWSCVIDFTGDYDNTPSEFADKAIEQITALEQKDVK